MMFYILSNYVHKVFPIHVDIDECASSPCEHTCTNTPGSFVCSCNDGYVLNSDGRTCTGKTFSVPTCTHIQTHVHTYSWMHMHANAHAYT